MRRPSFEVNFRGRLRRIQVLPFTETRRAWERKRGKQEGDASRLTEDRRWRSGCTSPAMNRKASRNARIGRYVHLSSK